VRSRRRRVAQHRTRATARASRLAELVRPSGADDKREHVDTDRRARTSRTTPTPDGDDLLHCKPFKGVHRVAHVMRSVARRAEHVDAAEAREERLCAQ
jgi:hypothetical protein